MVVVVLGKHTDIKDSDNYFTLDISLKFGSLDKMTIPYSWSKVELVVSGKGLINSLGIKYKIRPKIYKK